MYDSFLDTRNLDETKSATIIPKRNPIATQRGYIEIAILKITNSGNITVYKNNNHF